MERQDVIDVRVPTGTGGSGRGTLLLDERPLVGAVAAVAPPPKRPPGIAQIWAWRLTVAVAVLLVLAGLAAFASTPPA